MTIRIPRIRAGAAAGAAGIIIATVALTAPAAHAAPVQYGIRNLNSGKYLQPAGRSHANGVRIVQQPLSGAAEQRWLIITDTGRKTYENVGSRRNLSFTNSTTGSNAVQSTPSGSFLQDWRVVQVPGTNNFILQNRSTRKCLGVSHASTADGGQAAQFICDGSRNQKWQVLPSA